MNLKNNGIVYFFLVAACMSVYLHCLSFGVTNADDEVLITGNLPFLRDLSNVLKVFTTDAFYEVKSIDLYRPLQSASFILDAQWGSNIVFNAHLTNLLLHIASCLAVFHLLLQLELRRQLALLGALIYAVHYLFMTAVAWLPARGDLLLALFTFLTVITFIKLLETGYRRYYLFHLGFFAMAVFAKESAVVLPIILAVYVGTFGKRPFLGRGKYLLPVYYVMVIAGYFVLQSSAVVLYKGDTGFIPLLKNLRTLPEMVARFYLPVNVSTLPAYKLSATLTGVLLLVAFAGWHLYVRRQLDKKALFAPAWFLLFIVPGMMYYPVFYDFAFEHVDHRAYVTCFGLLLVNLNILQFYELDTKRYFQPVALLVLICLAMLNLYFSESYRNPAAFALRAIKTNERSAQAFSSYGVELYLQGKDDEALASLTRSIAIFSRYLPSLHTRAQIYRKRGLNREALADLDTLLTMDPEYDPHDYLLRGEIKADLQDYEGAKADFARFQRLSIGSSASGKSM